MAARHVVVDGSNLATEGRSMPSLAQLDQAVREFLTENPDDIVTVVVDASFGHRIDPSEFKLFEEAEAAGEVVSPPAGAIGRGDAFLLRIADKTGATVLSNDSFQEFHGDFEWLFDRGRLIGGKPVPGVGWIFTPRTPVRGPRSREAVKEAKRKTKGDSDSAMPGLDLAAERSRAKGKGKKTVERAIAVALEEAVAPKAKPRRRRKGGTPPAEPVNDPLAFITFIANHPLGGEVTVTVDSFASHGAFVDCEGARCYVPLSAMGDPPPKSARELFAKGDQVTLVVQALDPLRRGVELAVPGFAKIAGAPTEETVAAEIGSHDNDDSPGSGDGAGAEVGEARTQDAAPAAGRRRRAPAKKATSGSHAEGEPAKATARTRKAATATAGAKVEAKAAGRPPTAAEPSEAPSATGQTDAESDAAADADVPTPPRRRRAAARKTGGAMEPLAVAAAGPDQSIEGGVAPRETPSGAGEPGLLIPPAARRGRGAAKRAASPEPAAMGPGEVVAAEPVAPGVSGAAEPAAAPGAAPGKGGTAAAPVVRRRRGAAKTLAEPVVASTSAVAPVTATEAAPMTPAPRPRRTRGTRAAGVTEAEEAGSAVASDTPPGKPRAKRASPRPAASVDLAAAPKAVPDTRGRRQPAAASGTAEETGPVPPGKRSRKRTPAPAEASGRTSATTDGG